MKHSQSHFHLGRIYLNSTVFINERGFEDEMISYYNEIFAITFSLEDFVQKRRFYLN